MSKTTAYLVLLAIAATVAGVSTTLLLGSATAPTESGTAPSRVAVGILGAHLSSRDAAREAELELLALSPELLRVIDPSQSVRRSQPVLRPERPPERDSVMAESDPEQLASAAAALFQSRLESRGFATLALVNLRSRSIISASNGELALQLLTLSKDEGERRSGALINDKSLYFLSILPIPRYPEYALLAAEHVDLSHLQSWYEALAMSSELSLLAKGELLASTAQAPVQAEVERAAAELRSREAIVAPPEKLLAAQAIGEGKVVMHAVLPLEPLSETQSLALLLSAVQAEPAVGGLGQAPAIAKPGEHIAFWAASLIALSLLVVIGMALLRLDRGSLLARLRRAADDGEAVDLAEDERELIESLRSSAVPAPAPASKVKDDAELKRLRNDLESQEAKQAQLQRQLEHARSEFKRIKTELESAQSESAQQRSKLEELNSARERWADEKGALEQALEQARKAAAAAATPSGGALRAMPAPQSKTESVKEYPSIEVREFDTAEVSGEEMSQLLEEIDKGESPAANDEDESLTALAERIGRLSESQLSQLDAPNPHHEKTQPKGAAPGAESDGWDADSLLDDLKLDGSRTTSEHWRVPASSTETPALEQADPGRTLTGGFRNVDGAEAVPPPWKKDTEPAQALSPSTLLEALKRRGQGSPDKLDDPSEATKVSALSRSFADGKSEKPRTVSQSGVFTRTGSRVDVEPANDAEYFKSLFDEFLDTKKRCGENTDKITLDRFIQRLAKNKQALVERYDCRTVRFQVYVKDGRAALKATPVK
ncbi:MAG: MXAN_5187 C-terminal domain-containing protein [Myxococcota bacterium]|jgi:uncharacterized membrane-anchored protein YhcB (DUF1043 family)|nr:MXAN_5187 C-terminal domain-containing protein [Myxococcota bacterium]